MGKLKQYLLAFLIAILGVSVAQAANTKFTNVEVTGNMTVDGTLTSTQCQLSTDTLTVNNLNSLFGVVGSTAALTNSTMAVSVSSSTTSSSKLCLGGAFAALPTTGFNQGCLIYDTADQKLYISTQTVVGTQSWKSVGSQ